MNHYTLPVLFLLTIFGAASCRTARPTNATTDNDPLLPPPPDYAAMRNWAAHPDKADPADRTPGPAYPNEQANAGVDVFFLHPTTYINSRNWQGWNAPVEDINLNETTDNSTILYQASIFNGAGRVFAPRYRQAHLKSYYSNDNPQFAKKALGVAYKDVLQAFNHYLDHWNQGRPFILAGHSQGAQHLLRLLQERIANTPLQKRLVVAYIVGWPVRADSLPAIKPCQSPEETGCYCTWRTWERSYALKHAFEPNVVCTNPLTWTITEGDYAPASANKGGVLRKFTAVYPRVADAEVHKGILLCRKPKFPGSIFLRRKNYHIGDFNLYYINVRENAQVRAKSFH